MSHSSSQTTTERPPIVVIMGHIDHGKTTLLDYIRKANVAAGEAGGITQHTSAYEIIVDKGTEKKRITFVDTPGHAAFSSMRERGARFADIAILVVSAVEGVQVQTIEALRAIQDAGTPFIVALNKMDKPEADENRTKQSLAQSNIFVEGYGGSIPCVPISAKAGTGIRELLDMVLLVAEMESLTGSPHAPAEGIVVESHMDPRRGATATLIIQNGSLSRGMFLIIGKSIAPIRVFEDFNGTPIDSALMCSPVVLAGLPDVPHAGTTWTSATTKKEATEIAEKLFTCDTACKKLLALESDGKAQLPIVVKADAMGTLEAIEKEIGKLATKTADKVVVSILHSSVGAINENDVKLVAGTNAPIIIGFNVKTDRAARDLAETQGVGIHSFPIIYELEKFFTEEIERRTPKQTNEIETGTAKVLRVFGQTKDRQIIGGEVSQGVAREKALVRIIRRGHEIGRGELVELQQNRLRTKEVIEKTQFGANIEAKLTIAEGDQLQFFIMAETVK